MNIKTLNGTAGIFMVINIFLIENQLLQKWKIISFTNEKNPHKHNH